ncbi:MAG: DinB family protein [Anaerolineae bacterium]|nr:DinB family protein [Anaerolineae bacterium]
MPHLLVMQLRFVRSELQRCLAGVSDADARRRLGPMNCISWIVGHLAAQEHFLWVMMAQGRNIAPGLYAQVGFGQPPSTPPLDAMWAAWREITAAADVYLETLTPERLRAHLEWGGQAHGGERRHVAPAQHLPLLVPHGRGARHPAAARPPRPAGVRRELRRRDVPARSRLSAARRRFSRAGTAPPRARAAPCRYRRSIRG